MGLGEGKGRKKREKKDLPFSENNKEKKGVFATVARNPLCFTQLSPSHTRKIIELRR